MGLKKAAARSVTIIVILGLALLIGAVYNSVWHSIDKKNHPREYSSLVEIYAAEYGVPEHVVYAVMKVESNFVSNKVGANGEIGLMQLSEETFHRLLTMTKENLDAGILYDPETNIEYGTYYLSYLYTEYNRWDTVFAVYTSDELTVNAWQADPDYADDMGNLKVIPDAEVRAYVKAVNDAIGIYRELYYN